MKPIKFQPAALTDIAAISNLISKNNPGAAKFVVKSIVHIINQLGTFPKIGRRGRIYGTHEMTVPSLPFILVYKIGAEEVEIIAVFHTSRNRPDPVIN